VSVGACVALAAITLAAFWPVLGHDFTNLDDDVYVTENSRVQEGFTGSALRWAWTETHASNWHPLTWMSHMLDWRLFGADAGGHHLTSLLLHVANTLLLFVFLERATGRTARSAVAALLFAVDPLHVESVAWVAERKDVLSTLFWMLTMLAYLGYVRRPGAPRYALVVGAFALGLCAKPMLVTLPFALLLLDLWPLERVREGARPVRLLVEKIPLFVLAAASSGVTLLAQGQGKAIAPLAEVSILDRISNAIVSYVAYILKAVWPARLSPHYPHPRGDLSFVLVAGCALILVLLTVGIVMLRRRYPYLPVGWFWYLGTLVPVIGLVQVGEQAMADRYTYVPLIGIFIALVWIVGDLSRIEDLFQKSKRSGRSVLVPGVTLIVSVVVIAGFAITTRVQAGRWKDSITLFRHAASITEGSSVVHYHFARALSDEARHEEAIGQYEKALEIDPHWPEARNNLGTSLVLTGRTEDAIRQFEQALRLRPDYAEALNNLGVVLLDAGRLAEAVDPLSQAVAVLPGYELAHVNLGRALARQGRAAEAIESYQAALRIDPDFVKAHLYLGTALAGQGRDAEAIERFENAIRLDPANAEARNNLATILNKQGRVAEAIRHLSEAVRIRPDYALAHANLAAAFYATGRYSEAWTEIELARRHGAEPPERLLQLLAEKMTAPEQTD
jgi:tetratricopeptide (TPR) repeat protein